MDITPTASDLILFMNETAEQILASTAPSTTKSDLFANQLPSSIEYFGDNLTQIFGPKRDPLYVVIPITFIYMIIFLSGVIGNISTCIVISKNKSMHTATNYYLFSLAVSDFLLLLSGVPQEMYSIWSKYPYVFGEVFCVLRGLAAETSANATVLTITAFTVERYVAICHPFLSHTMSKLSRAVRLIILIWIISIALAIPQALQFGVVDISGVAQCVVKRIIIEHSFELSTFLFFFTPMTLITVLYVLIGLKLRSSTMVKRENGVTMQRRTHVNSCRQQTSQGTRRVLKMLVAVVVAFFLCWAPFHAQRLVAIYGSFNDHLTVYVVMTYISGILYYLSTCINPLLYNIMSNKFRQAFKETLVKCCQMSKRRYDKKRAYRVLSRSQRKRNRIQESTDYSGSSMRDESLYSTSTQKQSFDSMNYSDTRTTIMKIPQLDNLDSFDSEYDRDHLNQTNGGGDFMLGTIAESSLTGTRFSFNPAGGGYTDTEHLYNGTTIALSDEDRFNVTYNPSGHIKISVIPETDVCQIKNNLTNSHNNTNNNQSSIGKWFQSLFNFDRTTTRAHGYYSPPPTEPNLKKINFQLENDNDNNVTCFIGGGGDGIGSDGERTGIDDDGIISNSSLKDVDKYALEDELTAYMAELRLREQR